MVKGSERFHEILKELGELHDRKQSDYGSDADPFHNVRASEGFGIPAWVGALVRLNDKIVRLQSFAKKGSLANEGAEDSFKDIAVYSIIALCLYEEAGLEQYYHDNEEFDFLQELDLRKIVAKDGNWMLVNRAGKMIHSSGSAREIEIKVRGEAI